MKKLNLIFALAFAALGILVAVAPYTFAHVCLHAEKVMKCHWTARIELFLGLAIAVLGFAKIAVADAKFQLGVNLGIFLNALGVVLVPTVLIGVCGMKKMHCVTVAKPTLVVFGILIIAAVVAQSVRLWKKR